MWGTVKKWYKSPFAEDMDAFHWFLFTGLLIFIVMGWMQILSHIGRDA